ncbi:MAG: HD domain-containing protein [Myxococcales bacterium]|nr:HD domain-containing protein [Myxococcales bacterium]
MTGSVPKQLEFHVEDSATRSALDVLCSSVRAAGGSASLVGGCVRDAVLGLPATDLDIEIYGIEAAALVELLSSNFGVDLVGESFGVIRLRDLPIDVSLPRRESKRGRGHRGFKIDSDPQMDPREAASRRDFTINAIALDPESGSIFDPFGGVADLKNRILRHTTEKFSEDPLRVLRGMQFAARFELQIAPETIELCRQIEPEGLAPERILGEWKKLILSGTRPSLGLAFLRDCGWIRHFPELEALIGCEQNPRWHPEGDVWTHTLHCMDVFASERIGVEREDLIVGFGVLCHDLGKPATTTREEDGRITAKNHDVIGVDLTRQFLGRLTGEEKLIEEVVPLVACHLAPIQLFGSNVSDAAIRRLAHRVGRIDRLVRVSGADLRGRPPLVVDRFEAGDWLLERARKLSVDAQPPTPLLMGRHLIELGLEPGPHFGRVLEECLARQIEGEFDNLEAGLECARTIIAQAAKTPTQ